MNAPGTIRALMNRRWLAKWLLALFSLTQVVPVVALAATDGMAGMACCKHGRDSCCRRKPMQTAPSIRTGHPCGMVCAGTPTVAQEAGGAAMAPFMVLATAPVERLVVGLEIDRLVPGYDAAQFQRPPPVYV